MAIFGPVAARRPPDHDRHGLHVPGVVGRSWPTTQRASQPSAGQLLAANTAGAITAHVRHPVLRDPARRLADGGRRPRSDQRRDRPCACWPLPRIVDVRRSRRRRPRLRASWRSSSSSALVDRPARVVDPSDGAHPRHRRHAVRQRRGRDRVGPGGPDRHAQQLWVTGTAMTLLTVDAKLMPILPLIAPTGRRRRR